MAFDLTKLKFKGVYYSSWVGRLNFWLLRWLCIRLVYQVQPDEGPLKNIKAWGIRFFVNPLDWNGPIEPENRIIIFKRVKDESEAT